jgi:hypothetical protein
MKDVGAARVKKAGMISKSADVKRNKVDEMGVGSEDCSRDWHDSISHCAAA